MKTKLLGFGCVLLAVCCLLTACVTNDGQKGSAQTLKEPGANGYDIHGKLRVDGANLVDKNGEKVQLYGMSTHGIAWFPRYVNYEAFKTLRENWNTNCIRIAMYTAENGGYCTTGNKENLKSLVKEAVDWATQLNMYVIIDWHILNDNPADRQKNGDPNFNKEEAKKFFAEMSALYKDSDNVLYEICNEPNGREVTWSIVKNYANEVIPIIRANDPDAIILVGTPTWSQDIHQVVNDPLKFDNIMYTLHFYAATHRDFLRNRLEDCVKKELPVFISEFAICAADGNGGNDLSSGKQWMDLIMKHNLSFMAWNLANKAETSSVFKAGNSRPYDWIDNDMTDWGIWVRGAFQKAR